MRRRGKLTKTFNKEKMLLLMVFPGIVYYIIFHYAPMFGIIAAFQNFNYRQGYFGSQWVGFKWFLEFFRSYYFFRLIRNTLSISIFSLLFGFPVPIIFALLLNEAKDGAYKRIIQSVSYFPHFISTVIIVGLLYDFLAPRTGLLNRILVDMGFSNISFMTNPFWFKPVYITSGIWQKFGWSSIIYLAAISSIDPQLYDAAYVDGAGRWRQLIHITLPSIANTIIILLILRLGHLMSVGFEKILLMYSPANYETADVIQTYVYRRGIQNAEMSFATAVGLFNSIINFTLIYVFNRISRQVSSISLW